MPSCFSNIVTTGIKFTKNLIEKHKNKSRFKLNALSYLAPCKEPLWKS
jgi:hypothetical protein